jgi:hypothetical protein
MGQRVELPRHQEDARAEPTLAELMDPAALEARLVEARARRAEAIARRTGGKSAAPVPLPRRKPEQPAPRPTAAVEDPPDQAALPPEPAIGATARSAALRSTALGRMLAGSARGLRARAAGRPRYSYVLVLGFAVGVLGASAALVGMSSSLRDEASPVPQAADRAGAGQAPVAAMPAATSVRPPLRFASPPPEDRSRVALADQDHFDLFGLSASSSARTAPKIAPLASRLSAEAVPPAVKEEVALPPGWPPAAGRALPPGDGVVSVAAGRGAATMRAGQVAEARAALPEVAAIPSLGLGAGPGATPAETALPASGLPPRVAPPPPEDTQVAVALPKARSASVGPVLAAPPPYPPVPADADEAVAAGLEPSRTLRFALGLPPERTHVTLVLPGSDPTNADAIGYAMLEPAAPPPTPARAVRTTPVRAARAPAPAQASRRARQPSAVVAAVEQVQRKTLERAVENMLRDRLLARD